MAITKKFKAKGMHCTSCERLIGKTIRELEGVHNVTVDYPTETVEVTFDQDQVRVDDLLKLIDEKGYECSLIEPPDTTPTQPVKPADSDEYYYFNTKALGVIFGILGILAIAYFGFKFADAITLPEISQNMGYGLLFVVGLLTGFHCISMCGGFVVGYTTKHVQEGTKAHKSHLMYAIGKVTSYTVIGAVFGLLGSIIAFTPRIRGFAGIFAGLFLVVFGLNMLNVFPWLRKIRIKLPSSVKSFVGKESREHNKSPLIIGLLTGLMIACGPLQAIYILAAGTGSMIEGAKLLFVFALGTLPVMLGFGFLTSFISKNSTRKILKASGAIVIVLGLVMINRGLVLTGTGLDTGSLVGSVSASPVTDPSSNIAAIEDGYQIIRMDVTRYGWEPDKFVLKKDVPVKWIINGKEINGCNNAIQVPKYGLNFDIKPGEQVIEFTPTEEGVIRWSCWMGMIPGSFIVKDSIDVTDKAAVEKELAAAPDQPKGVCGGGAGGGSCGSPTCGSTTGAGGCGCGGAR